MEFPSARSPTRKSWLTLEMWFMRVLDLGCGWGRDLSSWGITASDQVTGLDIEHSRLATAQARFPKWAYLQGSGECLPFGDDSFDRVISALALPYMNIQKTLAEIHRVLSPGGGLSLSLHLPSFTIAELLHAFSAIRYGKRVGVPLQRQDCRVGKGEDGIVSDRARNEGRTESCWIRQSFIPPGNWAGRRKAYCGSKKIESDRPLCRCPRRLTARTFLLQSHLQYWLHVPLRSPSRGVATAQRDRDSTRRGQA